MRPYRGLLGEKHRRSDFAAHEFLKAGIGNASNYLVLSPTLQTGGVATEEGLTGAASLPKGEVPVGADSTSRGEDDGRWGTLSRPIGDKVTVLGSMESGSKAVASLLVV